MGNRQFHRTYELIIGKPNGGKGLQIIGDEVAETGLQIKFRVKKNLDNKSQSNSCSITLTNLSEETANSIQDDGLPVIFKVGYEGDNKVIFQGITSEVKTEERGRGSVDRETVILCTPANNVFYAPTISKTFPPNTTPRAVIDYLIGQSPELSKASFNSENIDKKFPFGYPVEGNIKQILNELSRDFNFQYRIDGTRLYVNDPNKYQSPKSVEKAFVISPETGLLGIPSKATSDGKKMKKDKTNKKGVKFTALLNPLLQPGQAVVLDEAVKTGPFRINSAEFVGDWRGNTWEVTCHCSKINAKEV